MARQITDTERADIIGRIRAGEPRNAIARATGRSAGTISDIAKTEGLSFDRSATKTATEARQVDRRATRAAMIDRLYALADRALGQVERLDAGGKYRLVQGTPSGAVIDIETTTAPARDRQSLAVTAAIWLDKATALERVDSGESGAAGLIVDLVDGLRAVAHGSTGA